MVTSGKRDTIFVPDLKWHDKGHSFDGIVSSVNIVAQEEEIGIRGITCDSEEFDKVVELSMDIAIDGHRYPYRLHIWLFLQDFFSLSLDSRKGNLPYHRAASPLVRLSVCILEADQFAYQGFGSHS